MLCQSMLVPTLVRPRLLNEDDVEDVEDTVDIVVSFRINKSGYLDIGRIEDKLKQKNSTLFPGFCGSI
jgi:hypothetical protein